MGLMPSFSYGIGHFSAFSLKKLRVAGVFLFSLLCLTLPQFASASITITPATYPGGSMGVQTWTKADGPYIIDGVVSERNGSLTVEPGTVIKFTAGSSLSLHADVHTNITGTADEPIYFTSIKDDSVGGDTNGDGAATTPAAGDWGYVSLGGGSWNRNMQMSYAKFRYGGALPADGGASVTVYPSLIVTYWWYNGSPGVAYNLSHVEASYGKTGALFLVGESNTLTVSDSSFHDNSDYGLYKYRDPFLTNPDRTGPLNASNNWWGSDTGPYNATLNASGTGNAAFGGKLTISPWLSADPLPDAPQYADCCSSVVFLPGIKGSVLKTGNDQLWPPSTGNLLDWSDDILQLAIDPNSGESVNPVTTDGILENFLGTPVYSGFTSYMDALVASSTARIKEWKPFAYDWRFDPDTIVSQSDMVQQIEDIAHNSNTGKVTIVAHSMGGLVGKALIKKLDEEGKSGLVDSFVMVGTPQLGTPQAIASILHGAGEDIGFGFIVNPASVRTIVQNMPSAYELLPSPAYFNAISDPVITFDSSASSTGDWISYFGQSINNYAAYLDFMTGAGVSRSHPPANTLRLPEVLSSSLMTDAASSHNALDSYVIPANIHSVQIAGWGRPTVKSVEYTDQHGQASYETETTVEGDKTVVYPSAISSQNVDTYYFNLDLYRDSNNKQLEHKDLVGAQPIDGFLTSLVEHQQNFTSTFLSMRKPSVSAVSDQLVVTTHSPVLLRAYDGNGNYSGIDPNQDPSAAVLHFSENIPGSTYLASTEDQSVYVPGIASYNFSVTGTDSGPASVEVSTVSGNTRTPVAKFTDFPVTPATIASFSVESNNTQNIQLQLDANGDGTPDMYVASDGGSLSLSELLTNLSTEVQSINASDKTKRQLTNKIAALQKKIDRRGQRQTDILGRLEAQVQRQGDRAKIDPDTLAQLTELIDSLLTNSTDVPLDSALLETLETQIGTREVKNSVQKSLLTKVDRLKNLAGLEKSLDAFNKFVSQKGAHGKLSDADVQNVLNILAQIQDAL